MPRKTDGIEFEIHPRPTKGEDGKPLLYVRPAKGPASQHATGLHHHP